MGADGAVALLAQIVLHFARVRFGGDLVHAEVHEKFCERFVPVEHACGDLHARIGERDEAVLVHGDVAVFLETLGGVGDAWLCHAEKFGNVNRADVAVLFLHHQHRFKIVFCCAQNFHRGYQLSIEITIG